MGRNNAVDAPFFTRLPAVMYVFVHSRRQPKKEKNTRLNPHSFAPFGLVAVAGFCGFRDTVDAPFFTRLPAVMYVFIHSRCQPKKEKNTRLNLHSFAPFGLVAVAVNRDFRDTVDTPFFVRMPAVMYAFVHSRRQPKKEKSTRLNPHSFASNWGWLPLL